MLKWEYFTLYLEGNGLALNNPKLPKIDFATILNEQGQNGWECFHKEGNISTGFLFLFKRPIYPDDVVDY